MILTQRSAGIGIMADSHGRPDTITAAAVYLKKRACTTLFHLGDICDSLHPETACACIDLIKTHGITALKGNNDHSLAGNMSGHTDRSDLVAAADYLQSLPVIYHHGKATFTHSQPFVEELGAVSLIGSMNESTAQRFFTTSPDGILFRGHAHTPDIMWIQAQDIVSRAIPPGETIDLSIKTPCVVTCGALALGYCMVWYPEEARLVCHRFANTGRCPTT